MGVVMSDPERDLELLKLVFSRHFLLKLARVDAKLLVEERQMLDEVCPPATLQEHGLMAADGTLTAAWVDQLETARRELPARLPMAEKLAMITRFVDMAVIDGDLHHDEGTVLLEAATELDVDPETFNAHLDGLTDQVGQVELADLEDTQSDP
ncbi:MAG: TerB family tellurite resistance protein [Myxococcota bacterium]